MKFWYSEKQKNVGADNPKFMALLRTFEQVHGLEPEPETRCFVTLDGREIEYTEAYGGDDATYSPNWDDAVFLGEGDGQSIRVVLV